MTTPLTGVGMLSKIPIWEIHTSISQLCRHDTRDGTIGEWNQAEVGDNFCISCRLLVKLTITRDENISCSFF